MAKAEATEQSKIMSKMVEDGAWIVKVGSTTTNGTPDVLGCYMGMFVAVEVKTEVGVLSRLQEIKIKQIREAEGIAVAVYGYEEFLRSWETIKYTVANRLGRPAD